MHNRYYGITDLYMARYKYRLIDIVAACLFLALKKPIDSRNRQAKKNRQNYERQLLIN
jgi:dTDP-4-amino-4,6-dideoxygalactose transaminase